MFPIAFMLTRNMLMYLVFSLLSVLSTYYVLRIIVRRPFQLPFELPELLGIGGSCHASWSNFIFAVLPCPKLALNAAL